MMAVRQRIWIDNQIQGVLVGRIFIYWLATLAYFGVGLAVSQYCDHSNWTFGEHLQAWITKVAPWLPSILLLLPLVLFDFVRTTHAIVGPVRRVGVQINNILQNPNSTPLVLRKDDYWQEIIDPVNNLQNQVLSLHMMVQKQRDAIDQLRAEKNETANSIKEDEDSDQATTIAQIPKSEMQQSQDDELKALSEAMTSAS